MNDNQQWFNDILKQLQEEHFYGKLVLEMKDGLVSLVRREETLKPPPSSG